MFNFGALKKKTDTLFSRIDSVRVQKAKAENEVSRLALMERDIETEITEQRRQAGIDLFRSAVSDRLPELLAKSDQVQAELDDLVRQYLAKFRELVHAEMGKPMLLADLHALRDDFEIWPKEAPLPDVQPRIAFCGIGPDGAAHLTDGDGLASARAYLVAHIGRVIKQQMREARK